MRHTFLSVAIFFTLVSCNRVYYAPNTPNPALLTEKNEGRVNAIYSYGGWSELKAIDLQFAYAVEDHWGIMANGFIAGRKENISDLKDQGFGAYGELAGGYFNKISKSKFWMAEVYGGFGGGWVNSKYNQHENSKVGVLKFFVQPAIGYKSPDFEVAFTPRIGLVNWKVNSANISSGYSSDLELISNYPRFFVFEPSLMMRFGTKDVKAQLGLTISSGGKPALEIKESLMLNAGLSFSFHTRRTGK